LATRVDREGVFVPLAEQDRRRWDHALVERGVVHLARASAGERLTPWHLEAGIACEHAIAPSVQETDWRRIVDLYDALLALAPGPIVALNRGVALAELHGPDAGRKALQAAGSRFRASHTTSAEAIRGNCSAGLTRSLRAYTRFSVARKHLDPAACLQIAETCTFFSVRKASRAVGIVFDEALRPSGLRATQFSLLVGLALVPSTTMSRLATHLVLDRTTLTRNLAPLERSGLVENFAAKDGRERRVRLTEAGARKLAQTVARWEQAQRNVVGRLGKTRWKQLLSGLKLAAQLSRRTSGQD
jgi:DNA-binding MarR family transcriptional regulator